MSAQCLDGFLSGIFKADTGDGAHGFDGCPVATDKVDHHGFGAGFCDAVDLFGYGWGGRFGDQDDQFRFGICNQRLKTLDHHQPTDLLLEVAPAGADDLREPLTQLVDLDGDFLRASARSANHADLSAPDGVGETKRFAIDDRRSAVRTHHQQAFFDCLLLEAQFIFNRHIIREQHDVQAGIQRVFNFRRRILTGHGDQDHVGSGQCLDR